MIREINIRAVLNGYVVQVGCQTVVYNSVDTLLVELRNYLIDPEDAEKRYAQFPNARFTLVGPAAPQVGNLLEADARVSSAADSPYVAAGIGRADRNTGTRRG